MEGKICYDTIIEVGHKFQIEREREREKFIMMINFGNSLIVRNSINKIVPLLTFNSTPSFVALQPTQKPLIETKEIIKMAMCNIVMQTEISVFAIDYCDYCGYCGSIDSFKKSN